MVYRITAGPLHVANYSLEVGSVREVDGKKGIEVQGHAQAIGLAEMIGGKVDDHFTSWIDVETGRSLRFIVDEYRSRSSDIEHTVVDIGHRDHETVPVTFHLNANPAMPEPQKASLPETWDYNAFLIALRAWEAPEGSKIVAEVFRSQFLWNIAITVRGKTKLDTELGQLPALRFDAHTYKLARDGTKFPADERDFSIWISDDAGRVPLQTTATTDYGPIKMAIVEYVAGSGEPLRR